LTVLTQELETYNTQREKLLATAEGKFVLIHGSEVIGTYAAEQDAIAEGYRKLGNVPFLVKKVLAVEPTPSFVSNVAL